jgi:hypothetical protein
MRTHTNLLITLGLTCASVAWTATVYRHTWGNNTTWPTVITAVAENEESRNEIATYIGARLADITGSDQADTTAATAALLATPDGRDALTTRLADATGTSSELLPSALDSVVQKVATLDKPDTGSSEQPPDRYLSTSSNVAEHINQLGHIATVAAIALLALASLSRTRRTVARKVGKWAAANGAIWLAAPYIINAAAKKWIPAFDATIAVATDTYTASIATTAASLTAAGVTVLVVERATRRQQRPARPATTASNLTVGTCPQPAADSRDTHNGHNPDQTVGTNAGIDVWAISRPDSTTARNTSNLDVWAAYDTRTTPPAP